MNSWREIFSPDNFTDYARASREILDYIRVLWKEGFDSIVIPSRGAMPIYNCAKTAWIMESQRMPTFESRLNSRFEYIGSPVGRELVLPFSADPAKDDRTQSSKDIRHFWTKILGALVRREKNSPYLIYYKFIVEQLVKDTWNSKLPFFLPNPKFTFIDTVVSGQAICEIFEAFESEALNECHFILLLDKNGSRLKKAYKPKIEEMEASGRCTLIRIRNLFTEDRGPAVSGVWSTVYPELMTRVRENYNWAADTYGAGSYYLRVANELEGFNNAGYNLPVTVINSSIRTILTSSLRNNWSIEEMKAQNIPNETIQKSIKENAFFDDYMVHKLLEDVSEYRPFDRKTTEKLAAPRILEKFPLGKIDVSSSHLVRVLLPDNILNQNMSILDTYLKNTSDVFDSDGYFRNV